MTTMTEEKEKSLLEAVAVVRVEDETQKDGLMKTEMIMIAGKINTRGVMMTTKIMVEIRDQVAVVVVGKVEEVKLTDAVAKMKDQVTKKDTGAARIDPDLLLLVEALDVMTMMIMMIVEERKEGMKEAKKDPNDEMIMMMITKEEVEQSETENVAAESQNLMKKKIEISSTRKVNHQPEVLVGMNEREKWPLAMKTPKHQRNGLQLAGSERVEWLVLVAVLTVALDHLLRCLLLSWIYPI